MQDYDPTAIRKMAGVLNTVANVTVALYAVAAVLFAVTTIVGGSIAGGQVQALAVLGGLVYGALVFGAGYLIALGLRVVAQLMLAVVQIECNTRAGAVAQVQTLSNPAQAKVSGETLTSHSRPADVRQMLEASDADSQSGTLRDAVSEQSQLLREHGDDYSAGEVFELGRRWALLFDETGDPAHREKALAAMTKARTIDPEYGRDFFDESALGAFGTLEADPAFGEFV